MADNLGYQFKRTYAAPIEKYRQVATIAERDNIPSGVRWEGMNVHVVGDQTYELRGGITNLYWQTASNSLNLFDKATDDSDDITEGSVNLFLTSTERSEIAANTLKNSFEEPITAKTTPVDADTMTLWDSAASFVAKKLTWANLKATLKTYFDTLYGNVTKVGTPVDNQMAVWTGDGTVEGTADITYDETELNIDVASVDNSVLNLDITGNAILKGKNDVKVQSESLISLGDSSNNHDLQINTVLGDVTFNNYGGGTKTGTQTALLGVDANGKIIEDTNSYLTTTGDASGLTNVDADTLDTLDSTQFLRSDVADTKTSGDLNFNDNVAINLGTGTDAEVYFNGTNTVFNSINSGDLLIQEGGSTIATFGDTNFKQLALKTTTVNAGIEAWTTLASGQSKLRLRNNAAYWEFRNNSTGDFLFGRNDATFPFYVAGAAPTNSFRISATGNISSIGEGSFEKRVTINSSAYDSVGTEITAQTGGWAYRANSNGSNFSGLYFDGSNHSILNLRNATGTITTNITSNGNSYFNGGYLALGHTSAEAQLDVRPANGVQGIISYLPNGNSDSLRLGRTDTASYWSFNHSGNDLRIFNKGGVGRDILLGIDAGGVSLNNKVGINNPTPSTELDVDGDITATGDITANSVNGIYRKKVSLSSAQILDLHDTPIEAIPAPGAGKVIVIHQMTAKLSYGTATYGGANSAITLVDSSLRTLALCTILSATSDTIRTATVDADRKIGENSAIDLYVGLGNPTTGDSPVDVYITYEIIEL